MALCIPGVNFCWWKVWRGEFVVQDMEIQWAHCRMKDHWKKRSDLKKRELELRRGTGPVMIAWIRWDVLWHNRHETTNAIDWVGWSLIIRYYTCHVSESDTPRNTKCTKKSGEPFGGVRTEASSFLSNRKYIYETMLRVSNLVALNLCWTNQDSYPCCWVMAQKSWQSS